MGRRVFLSILGAAFYEKCSYQKDDFKSSETLFVQKSLLEYLCQKENWGNENDEVLVFLTDLARKNNWHKDIKMRISPKLQKEVPYVGLEKYLQDMALSYRAVSIPDGKDNEQMWEIFEVIYGRLQEGDELYLDITNSFRYLPMLLVILVNYAKMLKHVSVKAIYYGNYEARNKETNVAPIMDLLPLSVLQDWTAAASDYLNYGQVQKLFNLTESSVIPILRDPSTRTKDVELLRTFVTRLKDMVEERSTCRGLAIIKSENLKNLEKSASDIQKVAIVQMKPIFEKIKESLKDFDAKENVLNCIKAARWCFDNKLYQQATTLLLEGLVTFLCCHFGLDYMDKDQRGVITSCISLKIHKKGQEDYDDSKGNADSKKVNKVLEDEVIWSNKDFVRILQQIVEKRNDYNHAGFNKDPKDAKKIIQTIEEVMNNVEVILGQI